VDVGADATPPEELEEDDDDDDDDDDELEPCCCAPALCKDDARTTARVNLVIWNFMILLSLWLGCVFWN